jgi:tryptase
MAPEDWAMGLALYASIAAAFLASASLCQADGTKKQGHSDDRGRIVGGVAADPNEWPWQVRLFNPEDDDEGYCGGSLIARQWVLTAAHCTYQDGAFLDEIVIGYGSNELGKLSRIASGKVIPHAEYDAATFANDIALIKLAKPAKIITGTTIDLPRQGSLGHLAGKTAWLTGWGHLYDPKQLAEKYPDGDIPSGELVPAKLQEVDVVIQDDGACLKSNGGAPYPEGQLCAGHDLGGKDSCYGDSGGAMVIADDRGTWRQAGIVSWGQGCAQPGQFGFYTRTDYHRDWIESTIARN